MLTFWHVFLFLARRVMVPSEVRQSGRLGWVDSPEYLSYTCHRLGVPVCVRAGCTCRVVGDTYVEQGSSE